MEGKSRARESVAMPGNQTFICLNFIPERAIILQVYIGESS